MINSKSSRKTILSQEYRQIKQLEKTISVGIESIAAKYLQSSEQIKRLAEQMIAEVKHNQKNILQRLQEQKQQLIQKIDSKWSEFKGYALLMRRIYFGESQNQILPCFNLEGVREILLQLNEKEKAFEKIVNDFERSTKRSKNQKALRLQLRQAQEPRLMQYRNIEISPIKFKERKQMFNAQSNIEDRHTALGEIQLSQEVNQKTPKIVKNHFFSSQHNENTRKTQQRTNAFVNPIKLQCKAQSKYPLANQQKQVSLSSAKSDNRQLSQKLHNIKSSDRIFSANVTSHNKSYRQVNYKYSERPNFREKSQLFLQKREAVLVKKSYKGCLQKLQKQQLQYEQMRHRFQ